MVPPPMVPASTRVSESVEQSEVAKEVKFRFCHLHFIEHRKEVLPSQIVEEGGRGSLFQVLKRSRKVSVV